MTFKKSLTWLYVTIAITLLPALTPLRDISFDAVGGEKFTNNVIIALMGITGMVGAAILFWSILLGVRFFVKIFTDDLIGVNKLHAWLGKWGAILVLSHPIFSMWAYLEDASWLVLPNFDTELEFHISLGRFALSLFILVWLSSAILRKQIKYRPWYYIHILTYPLFALTLVHIKDIGFYSNGEPIIQVIRLLAALTFIGIIIFRITAWAGLWKVKYKVQSINKYGDDVFTIKLDGESKFKIKPKPGQYVYMQTKRFGGAHPYSVLHFDEATNELAFGIKKVGKHSQTLSKLMESDIVYADGPYGVFTQEDNTQEKSILYAGGIGVTPFIDKVLRASHENLHLLYSVKDSSCILYEKELREKLGDKLQIFTTREENDNYIARRIEMEDYQNIVGQDIYNTNHFICGSEAFASSMVVQLESMGVPKNRIFTEEFSL